VLFYYFNFIHVFFIFLISANGGTAAVAACVGLAGWALAAIGGSALFEAFIFPACRPSFLLVFHGFAFH
jgi:hypothetical protein